MFMKVHRYSEHQRQLWVHEMVHKTKTVKAICTEAAVSRATLYNWLHEYNAVKKLTADQMQEEKPDAVSATWQPNDKYKMLLSVLVKTDTDKAFSCRLVRELVKRYNLTTAQACALVNLPEEAYGYRPRKAEASDTDVYAALIHALEEDKTRSLEDCIAAIRQLHSGWAIKQIKRVYRQGSLYVKRTRIRRIQHLPAEIISSGNDTAEPLRLTAAGLFLAYKFAIETRRVLAAVFVGFQRRNSVKCTGWQRAIF